MQESEANRLAPTMAANEAMPPRRDSHSAGAAPLRAASQQCNFLWVGQREGYLFFRKRYPSLAQRPFKARRAHRTQWGANSPAVLTDALTHAVRAQKKHPFGWRTEGMLLFQRYREISYRAKVLSVGMKVSIISTMSIAPIIGMIFLAMFMIGTSEIALAMKRFAP